MDSCYQIIKTSVEVYPYMVFATSYVNPMDQKEALEKDLKQIGVNGKILFDLLLSHGNTPDRFFEAFFNGEKISEESLKSTEAISKKIKAISIDFYHSQQHFLENSVLSKTQKFLIRRKKFL
jgi:hypothetical protein